MPHITGKITNNGCYTIVHVSLSKAHEDVLVKLNLPVPPPHTCVGLLDTGATASAISPQVVKALALVPTGRTRVLTPSTGSVPHETFKYDVSLHIFEPKSKYLLTRAIAVSESDLEAQGFDVLVGMDILGHCLFVLDGITGDFKLGI